MAVDIRRSRTNELANRQHGAFSRAQALALGWSEGQVKRRLATSQWESVLPGVYRLAGAPASGRQAAIAACLWAGAGAVVSHRAAGVLWDLDGVTASGIEVWVPNSRRLRTTKLTVHRTHELPRIDRTRRHGIPITTPARTLVDLACVLDEEALEAAVEDGLHRRLVSEQLLRRRLDELGGSGRPGTATLRRILDRRGEDAALESRLEVKVWRLLVQSGLPKPVRQHPVEVGGLRYRLDFAWPSSHVGVEADGFATHGARRHVFQADRRRMAKLASTGWRIVPVTWEDATARSNQWLSELGRTLALAS
jgi:very-short-patch-repair endonuclease